MPSRGKFFRASDRSSYKPSEVVGLFVFSIILGGFICLVCYAVDYSIAKITGRVSGPTPPPMIGRRLR